MLSLAKMLSGTNAFRISGYKLKPEDRIQQCYIPFGRRNNNSPATPGNNPHEPAYTIAEKQLYSSHYFETALVLTYCVSGDDPTRPGFYLIMFMGSEQAGLT